MGTEQEVSTTMDSVNYTELMMKVFAEIKTKLFWLQGEDVIVQHDGAPPHVKAESNLNAAGATGEWNIKMLRQPAQSPDMNILDLGLFHSMKMRNTKDIGQVNTVAELIAAVTKTYNAYDAVTLGHVWARLFANYSEILLHEGSNDMKSPHHPDIKKIVKVGTENCHLKIKAGAWDAAHIVADALRNTV